MIHRRLLQVAGAVPGAIFGLAGIGVALSILHIAFALSLGSVITSLIRGDGDVGPALVLLGVVTVVRAVVIWIREPFTVRVGTSVRVSLRGRLLAKLITVPAEDRDSGQTAATIIDGVDGLDAYYTRYLPQLLVVLVVPVSIVIIVGSYSSDAGIVLATAAAIAVLIPRIWDARLLRNGRSRWDAFSSLSSAYVEALQRIPLLRAFGAAGRAAAQLDMGAQQLRLSTMKQLRVSLVETVISASAMHLGVILAVIAALNLVVADGAQSAQAITVLLLARECFRPMQELATNWHAGYLGLTAVDGLDRLLSAHATITNAGTHAIAATTGTIEMTNVTYRHSDATSGVTDITLSINARETVAIVGPSGSGKSTLARLLERDIDPLEGQIRIGGIQLHDFTAHARSQSVVVLAQDPTLFAWSVQDNLRLYSPHSTRAELEQATRTADIHDVICALPHGYNTVLAENGEQLSGGQRQRLAIARALLSPAPVLILDEVTSALDDATEKRVMDAIAKTQNRTIIIIAHRESACTHVDRWIALTEGRITARGHGRPVHKQGAGGAR